MNKFVRDGQVAVLYSPGFGAGWSSWANGNYVPDVIFDPCIVDLVLDPRYEKEDKIERIKVHCALKYPDLYLGGLDDITVEWLPQGVAFRINEYDGSESIEVKDSVRWLIA
jgi:hypothetical protein